MTAVIRAYASLFVLAAVIAPLSANAEEPAKRIALSGDRAYPESIAAAADGALYVSSLASGGIWRIKPGSATAEAWIAPGAYDTRSTFGVLVDDKRGVLWVCSNDISALGVPGPGTATGSNLKAFDLVSGEGKMSVPFPGTGNICNDMAIGADGALYATNSLKPEDSPPEARRDEPRSVRREPGVRAAQGRRGPRRHRLRRRRQPISEYVH